MWQCRFINCSKVPLWQGVMIMERLYMFGTMGIWEISISSLQFFVNVKLLLINYLKKDNGWKYDKIFFHQYVSEANKQCINNKISTLSWNF